MKIRMMVLSHTSYIFENIPRIFLLKNPVEKSRRLSRRQLRSQGLLSALGPFLTQSIVPQGRSKLVAAQVGG
jgi:hypothetical protein